MNRVLVMGASGRLGAYLRQFWPGLAVAPQWQYRANAPAGALLWAPLQDRVPDCAPVDTVLCLSGVTQGAALAQNTDLALAALEAARALGARRVVLTSSAAVYGATCGPHDEDETCHPITPYGVAKLAMERAALAQADMLKVTCLRIGNVAGADALLGGLALAGVPRLDQFADGRAAHRAYIGPMTLARVLAHLCCHPKRLPSVLNVAQPGLICMDTMLAAAQVTWEWRPAPSTARAELGLHVGCLQALCPVPHATPESLVSEWRLTWAASRRNDGA
ncbi:NAD-dependent epimerase/dehydratase [Roseibaca sp. V10]|uniref:NAD-dependent epimerase/dehydratase n=1 Tax=Roseinatronobacter domitianus TaxID=2940293 RepID=A0ABT0M2G6_9RHOB|nr:NAD-dependent epimerase/dehydratase family protein [Roseibaca domitiana]MCL1629055.1 NAD-dependent epimerase/dehydratase [Roseibaca domitiana]